MKELECPQDYMSMFRHSRADNSSQWWEGYGRNSISLLDTYKNEEDLIKNEVARVATTFLPLSVYGDKGR